MECSKRMNIWACIVFFALCCVDAQQEQGACVPYYLCSHNGTIISDGRGLIVTDRKTIPKCESPIEVYCSLPSNYRERRSAETTEETPLTEQSETSPKVVIPSAGCGVRRKVTTSLSSTEEYGVITGATNYAEFPWMVALLEKENDGNQTKLKCGASLVDRLVVVTAAHCVAGIDKNSFTVRAGDWDLDSESEPLPSQDRSVQTVIVHPEFNPSTLQNDIALLIVNSAFELTKNIDIICLPNADALFDKTRCVVAGWGGNSSENGADKRILRKVDLSILPNDECQEQLRSKALGKNFTVQESSICTGGEVGKHACQGNDGSPLMCPLAEEPKHWAQIGIVSWSVGCNGETPAVYTSLTHFVEWILN